MQENLLSAEVRLINDSIKFSCTSGDNPPIVTDYYLSLRSNDITEADLDKAVSMAEEKYCPVWAMIKGNVEVERQYFIEKE